MGHLVANVLVGMQLQSEPMVGLLNLYLHSGTAQWVKKVTSEKRATSTAISEHAQAAVSAREQN